MVFTSILVDRAPSYRHFLLMQDRTLTRVKYQWVLYFLIKQSTDCWCLTFLLHYALVFSLKFSIKTKLMFVVKVYREKWGGGSKRKGIFIDQPSFKGNLMEISLQKHMDLNLSWYCIKVSYSIWEKKTTSSVW